MKHVRYLGTQRACGIGRVMLVKWMGTLDVERFRPSYLPDSSYDTMAIVDGE